jgi:hypothetical protein
MAQTQVNIRRLVDNIRKTTVYTALVEAIANSIDSIEESNRNDGEIVITLVRDTQNSLGLDTDDLKPIISVHVTDNGVGFNAKNLEAFNTIYTEEKIRKGGKGFGRFVFLKYFENVTVESTYNDRGTFQQTSFDFVKDNIIIQNEARKKVSATDVQTTIRLESLKREHISKLDKKFETVTRKLLEKLLVYFVLDNYKCPKIIVSDGGKQIVLNDYLGDGKEIVQIEQKEFTLESADKSSRETFKSKVFKIFYGESRSSVNLVADNRQVTEEALHTYIPEFKAGFYDVVKNEKGEDIEKNYTIKTYVLGRYLDNHVSLERDGFEFEYGKDLFYPFSRSEIEKEATSTTRDVFAGEVKMRQDKKEKDIKAYVDEQAPWHKTYASELDLTKIPYGATVFEMESELQKVKYLKEVQTKTQIDKILEDTDETEVAKKTEEIISKITEIGRSELVHYIALRRTILDVFRKALTWDDTKKFEKEKVIHDIIFPTNTDSDTLSYDNHNLWILDEKLSFTEYLASDKALNKKDERPDLLIFDNKMSFRAGEEASNPIVVFEFKRPQRADYGSEENPLKQIADYVKKVRSGNFKNPDGRPIYTNENTPAYGFLVCDLTPQIDSFCSEYSLTKSSDNKGYFGFHSGHKIYYEVVSFDKLVSDSELRNKIFFKKLGI